VDGQQDEGRTRADRAEAKQAERELITICSNSQRFQDAEDWFLRGHQASATKDGDIVRVCAELQQLGEACSRIHNDLRGIMI